jgi:hypothetical protein
MSAVIHRNGWLSICAIDNVAKMLCVAPERESYNILRALHCVKFNAMPQELAAQVPALIAKCLDVPPVFQFPMPEPAKAHALAAPVATPEPERAPRRRSLLGWMR